MTLLTAIFSLSCIFVGLAAASPTHAGLTGSQENGELLTKRSIQIRNWVNMNHAQNLCNAPLFVSTQPGGVVSESVWSGILEDCQSLRSQVNSQNGYTDVGHNLPSSSMIVLSYGNCTLSVEFYYELLAVIPFLSLHMGNSDIINIVNLSLEYMVNATTPDEQFSSVAGKISCNTANVPIANWNLTLQNSSSTDHAASLTKRTSHMIWETTFDTPQNMCSDSKNVTVLPGSPGGGFMDITHDCQALQATYNSSNEGYWDVTLDDDDTNHFNVLASQGVCSLLFIVLGRPKLPVRFQVGNTDISDIIGNSMQLLYTGGADHDTIAVTGRMGCDTDDDSVQVMWAVAFDDVPTGGVDMAGLKKYLEQQRSIYTR